METFTLIIYLVGIAAFVDAPAGQPGKIVVFPAARLGTYQGHILMPHRTWLHIPGASLVSADPETTCRQEIGGTWEKGLCSLELRGARVSFQSSEPFTPRETFGQMPAFGRFCPEAPMPKRVYTAGTDPDFVAARFQMSAGVAAGCRRKHGAFVTKLTVETTYGVLVVERGEGVLRIRLRDDSALTIENRPEAAKMEHVPEEHYGWYYFIASGDLTCPLAYPKTAAAVPLCSNPDIPGLNPIELPSATGPDCGNTGYP